MGPFPIELQKENGAANKQPRGARDGTFPYRATNKEKGTSYEMPVELEMGLEPTTY